MLMVHSVTARSILFFSEQRGATFTFESLNLGAHLLIDLLMIVIFPVGCLPFWIEILQKIVHIVQYFFIRN